MLPARFNMKGMFCQHDYMSEGLNFLSCMTMQTCKIQLSAAKKRGGFIANSLSIHSPYLLCPHLGRRGLTVLI